jgi:DNA repair protein SbcD/Mre11
VKLFHVADIHLGRRRLEGRLPDTDLAAAFGFIADQAIAAKADLFLIAGDLFDRPIVEPPHLRQGQKILGRLKANGIPVIAIEGNHDRAFLHSEEPTWIQFLAEDDLLVLLRTRFDSNGPILTPWDAATKTGSWFDCGGIRFVGAGYLGAATPFKVRQIVSNLESGHAHVLLLHAGPDYFVGEGGGFSPSELKLLKEKTCYLALGHIHRPMLYGDWACNPGSPENCDIHEASYDADTVGAAVNRGYAVVELDPAQRSKPVSLRIHTNPRRPVVRLLLDCTPFGNKTKNGAGALVEAACKLIRTSDAPPEALIDLRLTGILNLSRIALDQTLAATEIAKEAQVFAVSIDLSGLSVGGLLANSEAGERIVTREELEKGAIRDAFHRRYHLGIEDRDEELCALFYHLKEAVRRGTSGIELAENIERSPLVDLVEPGGPAAPVLASALESRDQEASA